ncbi:hypothetical protein B6U74_04025 [Candidatus Bathyarchaeota archaeon ex4484_205]|nr:MAG: hypothetical protein B6U74_04025 [Candidatus Bathyarchaeota archaeon ex4484_205]RLG68531.1 MAG: hypothetical protein DRN93_02575 [archaeon]
MGRVEKGIQCSVAGCKERAVRSVSRERAVRSGLKIEGEGRKAYLCREHYKDYKKALKDEMKVMRMRWRA